MWPPGHPSDRTGPACQTADVLVLAIDLGTSGVKVAVVDDTGAVRGMATESLPIALTADGGAEHDAELWWQAIGRCARGALAAAATDRVDLVAVTSQFMSTVAVDPDGRPMSPVVLWMDHRGAPHHPVLDDDEAFFLWLDRHGLPPMSNDGLAHIGLLRHLDPGLVDRGARFVEPVDAVTARLTGRVTATQNTAFGLMACDNRVHGSLTYDPEMLALAGIDHTWLPTLVGLDEPLGELTTEARAHLGLAASAVVMPGTIDSITSAIGTGAVGPDAVSLVIGTTSVIVSHVPGKRADFDNAITSVPSPVAGQYFVMAENGVGGKALDFVLRSIVYPNDELAVGGFPDDAFERAEAAAARAPAGSGGTLFFPWLVGAMSPAPDDHLRAGFANLGLSTSRAHLVRAVLEGVALNAAWLFDPVCAFTGHRPEFVRFGGGGARSATWAGILASALDRPVHRLAEPSIANARGAALLALVQHGALGWDDVAGRLAVAEVHEPVAAEVAVYRELGERFREYHALTRGFHASLPHHP